MLQQERKEVRDSSIHPEARWLSDLHNESREPWPALGFDLGRWRGRTNRHKSVMPRLWFERHGARGLHLFSLAYDFRFRLRWCSRPIAIVHRRRRRSDERQIRSRSSSGSGRGSGSRGWDGSGNRRKRGRRRNRSCTSGGSSFLLGRWRIQRRQSTDCRLRLRVLSISLPGCRRQDRSRSIGAWRERRRLGGNVGQPRRCSRLSVHPWRASPLLWGVFTWSFLREHSSVFSAVWMLPWRHEARRRWHGSRGLASRAHSRCHLPGVVHAVAGQVIALRHCGSISWG